MINRTHLPRLPVVGDIAAMSNGEHLLVESVASGIIKGTTSTDDCASFDLFGNQLDHRGVPSGELSCFVGIYCDNDFDNMPWINEMPDMRIFNRNSIKFLCFLDCHWEVQPCMPAKSHDGKVYYRYPVPFFSTDIAWILNFPAPHTSQVIIHIDSLLKYQESKR